MVRLYKKVLKFLFILIDVITVSLWLIYIINQHNNIIAANEFDLTNNYAQLGFPKYQENNVDYFKQLQVIQKTSDQLKIPFLKRTYYLGSGINYEHYNYNKHIQNVLFEVSDLDNTALKNNFNVDFHNGNTYSTIRTSTTSHHLKKYSNINFTVKQISFTEPPKSREGIFFIQTQDISLIQKYIRKLRLNYNHAFKTSYKLKDFQPTPIYSVSDDLSLESDNIKTMAETMVIFQIVFFIIYIFSFIYDIGIYKLLGFNSFRILKEIMLPELLIGSLLPLTGGIIYELLERETSIIWDSVSLLLLIALLELVFTYGLVTLLQYIPTNRLIIKQSYARKLFEVSFISKGLLLIFLLSTALPLANTEFQILKNLSHPQTSTYSKYVNFYPNMQGYNEELSPMRLTKIEQKYLYPKLENDGSLFIDTSQIITSNPYYQRSVDINTNYLRFNPLYNLSNETITMNQNEHRSIILLPQKNMKYRSRISNYFVDKLKLRPHFVIIKNNQYIFDTQGRKKNNYAYINVFTRKNVSKDVILDIFTGDADDTIKIPKKGRSPKQIYRHYLSILEKYNLRDNLPQIIRSDQSRKADLANIFSEVYVDIFVIIISFVMFIMILAIMMSLYFSVYGRTFTIKQTLGMSTFRSMLNYWLLWLLQIILVIVVLSVFIQKITDPPVYLLFITAIFIDFIVSLLTIHLFSRKAVGRFLNE